MGTRPPSPVVVGSITVEVLAQQLKDPRNAPVLLDVREDDEREVARIEPSIHIPMNQITRRAAELPTGRPIVVYCHHGGRSEMVAGFLESHGRDDVLNLEGGIDAWSQRVDPRVARY